MPTLATVPLLILISWLWYRTNGNILSVVLFTSVFEAASAANFGNLGLSPPLFSLILCLGFKLLQGHSPIHLIPGLNKTSLYLLIAFILYAVCTGIAYPFIFEGVLVMHGATATYLVWSVANFAQICYLIASILLYFLAISSSRKELENAIDWYIHGCVVSTFVAVYQLANAITHVPYPESILYSNPSHVIYRAYMINGMWRLNSTFPEASEFSTFITVAISLLGWQITTKPSNIWKAMCLILMIIMLIMTESSLGYICLLFTLVLGLALYAYQSIKRRGVIVRHVVITITAFTIVIITLIVSSMLRQSIDKLMRATLVDKKTSESYRDRSETHTAALDTLIHTYYLGAGWGSVRASGLAFVLLGNVGLVGFTLFVFFCSSLLIPLLRLRQRLASDQYILYEQCLFSLGVMLIGLFVAGAEPVQPILWVMFGVATVARIPVQHMTRQVLMNELIMRTHKPARRFHASGSLRYFLDNANDILHRPQ